jgi:hypothetical protein
MLGVRYWGFSPQKKHRQHSSMLSSNSVISACEHKSVDTADIFGRIELMQ